LLVVAGTAMAACLSRRNATQRIAMQRNSTATQQPAAGSRLTTADVRLIPTRPCPQDDARFFAFKLLNAVLYLHDQVRTARVPARRDAP
jgi:hypothetical protein